MVASLNPRLDLWDYGSETADWGHGDTPGTRQLALAILADATGYDAIAYDYHEAFATRVLGFAPPDQFAMHEVAVVSWVLHAVAEASPYTTLTNAMAQGANESERGKGGSRNVH